MNYESLAAIFLVAGLVFAVISVFAISQSRDTYGSAGVLGLAIALLLLFWAFPAAVKEAGEEVSWLLAFFAQLFSHLVGYVGGILIGLLLIYAGAQAFGTTYNWDWTRGVVAPPSPPPPAGGGATPPAVAVRQPIWGLVLVFIGAILCIWGIVGLSRITKFFEATPLQQLVSKAKEHDKKVGEVFRAASKPHFGIIVPFDLMKDEFKTEWHENIKKYLEKRNKKSKTKFEVLKEEDTERYHLATKDGLTWSVVTVTTLYEEKEVEKAGKKVMEKVSLGKYSIPFPVVLSEKDSKDWAENLSGKIERKISAAPGPTVILDTVSGKSLPTLDEILPAK